MKPKTNQKGDTEKSATFDRCQTPFYALDPLIPFLPKCPIWEPAAGDKHIVQKLESAGFYTVATDILTNQNFFETEPPYNDCCQVTNPPYSIKYDWLRRSYELGIPFALLLPLESLGSAKGQKLFERYGVEIILLDKRINFKMPHKGYSGAGAQFPVAWFTWRLGIGQQITYGKICRYEDGQLSLFDDNDTCKMRIEI